MTTYKLRAECLEDVLKLIERIAAVDAGEHIEFHVARMHGLFDVELEISTGLEVGRILTLIEELPDAHLMQDTIKPLAQYSAGREGG
ncbi:MAG: hypothetical protein JWP97_5418 [Labilithrix sp.]|nr:hypothetical protein [Labilithrix sp.]